MDCAVISVYGGNSIFRRGHILVFSRSLTVKRGIQGHGEGCSAWGAEAERRKRTLAGKQENEQTSTFHPAKKIKGSLDRPYIRPCPSHNLFEPTASSSNDTDQQQHTQVSGNRTRQSRCSVIAQVENYQACFVHQVSEARASLKLVVRLMTSRAFAWRVRECCCVRQDEGTWLYSRE